MTASVAISVPAGSASAADECSWWNLACPGGQHGRRQRHGRGHVNPRRRLCNRFGLGNEMAGLTEKFRKTWDAGSFAANALILVLMVFALVAGAVLWIVLFRRKMAILVVVALHRS